MDCTANCRSHTHGDYLTSSITSEIFANIKTNVKESCGNPFRVLDHKGRYVFSCQCLKQLFNYYVILKCKGSSMTKHLKELAFLI